MTKQNKTKQNKTKQNKTKQNDLFELNKFFKKSILVLSLGLLITSCQNEDFVYQTPKSESVSEKPQIPFESITFNENGKLKLKFAEAFSNALVANKDLRRLVKDEALKKFDKDYDVLYLSVKSKSLTPIEYLEKSNSKTSNNLLQKSANALTFREAILPFFSSEAELIEIEQKLPLLTIFVPELPLGFFSAETWDVNDETQIPDVALRLNNTNDIPVVGKDGSKYVIEAELTPGFPIVVIKENERVRIINKNSNSKNHSKIAPGEDFEFIDDNFDPNASTGNSQIVNTNTIDPLLIDSYNVWEGYASGGWQRDHIYYGLTPTKTIGSINGNYREYVTNFKLTGNPENAYNLISGHNGDPAKETNYRLNTSSGWTDGNFEFRAYCYFGAKASNVGASAIKLFQIKPSDLFELKFEAYSRFNWPVKKTYIRTSVIGIKSIDLLDAKYNQKLEFETWDLNRFSNEWKFSFEETDITTEINKSESLSQKYNANLNLDTTLGTVTKVGLKFGASFEETKTNSYTMKYTTQSDYLGDIVVPFYDNVVNKDLNTGQIAPRTYSTGTVEFVLKPIRVQ